MNTRASRKSRVASTQVLGASADSTALEAQRSRSGDGIIIYGNIYSQYVLWGHVRIVRAVSRVR